MHHGSDNKAIEEVMKRADEFSEAQRTADDLRNEFRKGLGATGRHPQGKLVTDDEGEILIAVGNTDGKVVVEFGKPIAWIGFSPEQALDLAQSIRAHAMNIKDRQRKQP